MQQNAAERRGTHATKTRAMVSGSRQEAVAAEGHRAGAGRRDPEPAVAQGRHRVRAAAAQLRVRPAEEGRRGALLAALAQKAQDGALVIVDKLEAAEKKTKATAQMLKRLGATGKTLIIDVTPQDGFALSARNIAGVTLVPSARVTARDVMDTTQMIATREAIEKLQESLGN